LRPGKERSKPLKVYSGRRRVGKGGTPMAGKTDFTPDEWKTLERKNAAQITRHLHFCLDITGS
jgi:hypothetical protein